MLIYGRRIYIVKAARTCTVLEASCSTRGRERCIIPSCTLGKREHLSKSECSRPSLLLSNILVASSGMWIVTVAILPRSCKYAAKASPFIIRSIRSFVHYLEFVSRGCILGMLLMQIKDTLDRLISVSLMTVELAGRVDVSLNGELCLLDICRVGQRIRQF